MAHLTEYANNRGVSMRVDRDKFTVHGVKVLGLESKNGRSYTSEAISAAACLYEGKNVNVDHPKGKPTEPRDYGHRFGTLENVQVKPDGLYADLVYNPKHGLAEQFLHDAEHAPHRVGLSHNVEGKTSFNGKGKVVVESITKVAAVDIVADPATTSSLFEAEGDMPDEPAPSVDPVAAILDTIGDKIVEIAKSDADLSTKKAQITDLLKKQDKIKTMLSDEKPPADKPAEEPKTEATQGEINLLREEVQALKAENAKHKREKLVEQKITAAKLPEFVVTDDFRAALTEAKDETAINRLIETVKNATRVRPQSRDQNGRITEAALSNDTTSFVARLKG